MKSYSKGVLVGMSIVLGSFLLMGYTSSESDIGRYQLEMGQYKMYTVDKNGKVIPGQTTELEGFFRIDTKTGEISQYQTYYYEESGTFKYLWGDRK